MTQSLGNGVTSILADLQTWPMVLGESDGKYISLLDTHVLSAQSNLFSGTDAPSKLDLGANMALVGCHLEDPEEAAFVAAIVEVENLTAWSQRSSIEIKVTHEQETQRFGGSIEMERLDPLVAIAGPLEIKLHQLSWLPHYEKTRSETKARVRERVSMEFASAEPRPMTEWMGLANAAADLMSLSALRACGLISMRVYLPPTPERFSEGHPRRNLRHEVEVYVRRVKTSEPDAPATTDMVLLATDLPFEELMPRWLEVHDRFAAARAMILGLRYVTGGYVETRVVTAVAAAEAMHRALNLGPRIPEDEFNELRGLLMMAVPKERKPWLSDILGRNEPTLKQRLLSLVARPGSIMHELVPDPETWAQRAGQARNTLAHEGAAGAHTFEDLYAIIEVTAAVVVINMLFELGVPEDGLRLAIERSQVLSRAADLAREHLTPTPSKA